eukprot:m.647276 g.647276  ORF g.647276 m.647276 type:complete len:240 (-) comp22656_c0_seq13:2204-2923(-)
MPTLVIDNGAGNIKAGWSTDKEPVVFDNAKAKHRSSKRTYIGPVIGSTKNKAGLVFKRPFQKGFLIDSELQREIWSTAFGPEYLNVDAKEASLLVTEPLFNFKPIQESIQELAFEEFGVASMFRAPGTDLSAHLACKSASAGHGSGGGCLILDAGFSFTNAVPYVNGKRVDAGIRRVDVGGKMLTNHLKDLYVRFTAAPALFSGRDCMGEGLCKKTPCLAVFYCVKCPYVQLLTHVSNG